MALTVLTLVMSSLYAVFTTATRNLTRVEAQADLAQTARVVLGDLRRELGSVYPMWVPLGEEERAELTVEAPEQGAVSFAGEDAVGDDGRPSDNLRFTAAVPEQTEEGQRHSNIAELMYLIDTDDETPETGLVRRANYRPGLAVDEAPDVETVELTPLATSFEVQFWAGDDEETLELDPDGDGWIDGWQDPAKLPSAVKLTLGLTPPEKDATERRFTVIARVPIRAPRPDLRPTKQQPETGLPGQTPLDQGAAGGNAAGLGGVGLTGPAGGAALPGLPGAAGGRGR